MVCQNQSHFMSSFKKGIPGFGEFPFEIKSITDKIIHHIFSLSISKPLQASMCRPFHGSHHFIIEHEARSSSSRTFAGQCRMNEPCLAHSHDVMTLYDGRYETVFLFVIINPIPSFGALVSRKKLAPYNNSSLFVQSCFLF